MRRRPPVPHAPCDDLAGHGASLDRDIVRRSAARGSRSRSTSTCFRSARPGRDFRSSRSTRRGWSAARSPVRRPDRTRSTIGRPLATVPARPSARSCAAASCDGELPEALSAERPGADRGGAGRGVAVGRDRGRGVAAPHAARPTRWRWIHTSSCAGRRASSTTRCTRSPGTITGARPTSSRCPGCGDSSTFHASIALAE